MSVHCRPSVLSKWNHKAFCIWKFYFIIKKMYLNIRPLLKIIVALHGFFFLILRFSRPCDLRKRLKCCVFFLCFPTVVFYENLTKMTSPDMDLLAESTCESALLFKLKKNVPKFNFTCIFILVQLSMIPHKT